MIRLNRSQDARPMRFSALDYDRCRSVFDGVLVRRYPIVVHSIEIVQC